MFTYKPTVNGSFKIYFAKFIYLIDTCIVVAVEVDGARQVKMAFNVVCLCASSCVFCCSL